MSQNVPYSGVLTPRQRRAIAALMSTPTLEAAADKCGVNRKTIARWLKQPDFMSELKVAQRQTIADASLRLDGGVDTMLNVLVRLALGAHSESVRKAAVSEWFAQMHLFHEAGDIEDRLTELEKAVKVK